MLSIFNPDNTSLTPAERHEETEMFRYIAQSRYLFGLCRYRRCFRNSACLHDPRECVARYAPLAPQGARDFMRALLDNGARNEDDIERLNLGDEDGVEEFMYWRTLVENVSTPGAVKLAHLFERNEEDVGEENI
jgi:hypothetical protein